MGDLPLGNGDLSFDFITDEQFRTSLESDYRELNTSVAAGAAKGALVLSGSIVEAVLADYLLSTGQKKPDPLRMDLGQLIDACTAAGVLTERTKNLSSVIRSYRNLIHPGRVLRLAESYGAEDASVACHVVKIVVREVAARQVKEFGLTAEQAVTKFETDHNAPAIVELLLREVRPHDIRRLILDVLPPRYFEHFEGPWDVDTSSVLDRLEILYHAAISAATDDVRKAAAKRYVAILREGAGSRVEAYDEVFFRAPVLEFLTNAERELVIAHFLGRLSAGRIPTPKLLRAIVGMSSYLPTLDQFVDFADGFIRTIAYADDHEAARATETFAEEYRRHTTQAQDEAIDRRLGDWIGFLDNRGLTAAAQRLRQIQGTTPPWDDDIPF